MTEEGGAGQPYEGSKKLLLFENAARFRKQEFFVRVELCTAQPHQVELYTIYPIRVRRRDKSFL